MTSDEITDALRSIAEGFRNPLRSPVLGTPADVGLAYDEVTFPAADGVAIEGWLMPRAGSDRIVIVNHPRGFSRTGLPSRTEPWRSQTAPSGNDVDVDFLPDFRLLHDAGYNVLAYDLRNFGLSGTGTGGIATSGRFEARDVIGSLDYVRGRADLSGMAIGLFSRCLGCNATIVAMSRAPDRFRGVRCLVGVQPLSPGFFLERQLALLGIAPANMPELDRYVRLVTSFTLDQLSPLAAAADVATPTLLLQVRDDNMTRPEDVQAIFDAMPVVDKQLYWIMDTTRRWDGYLHFQRHPQVALDWLARHMG